MPHITIEYSANLKHDQVAWAMLQINQLLGSVGIFENEDIKTKAYRNELFQIGDGAPEPDGRENAYFAVTLELLSGRDSELKELLIQALLGHLEKLDWPMGLNTQVSVLLREMPFGDYGKRVIGP